MDSNNTMGEGKVCKCPHHKVMPIVLILIGLTVLCGDFNWFSAMTVNVIWPILLIIGAATKLGGCKCCAK